MKKAMCKWMVEMRHYNSQFKQDQGVTEWYMSLSLFSVGSCLPGVSIPVSEM